jgi:hypothetical protein
MENSSTTIAPKTQTKVVVALAMLVLTGATLFMVQDVLSNFVLVGMKLAPKSSLSLPSGYKSGLGSGYLPGYLPSTNLPGYVPGYKSGYMPGTGTPGYTPGYRPGYRSGYVPALNPNAQKRP